MILEISAAAALLLYLRSRTVKPASRDLPDSIASPEIGPDLREQMGIAASAAATEAAPKAAAEAIAGGATPEQVNQAAASAAAGAAQAAANDFVTKNTIYPITVQGIINDDGTTSAASGQLTPKAGDQLRYRTHWSSLTGKFPVPYSVENWKKATSGDVLIRNGVSYIIDKPEG
jgi:hypothetical protein